MPYMMHLKVKNYLGSRIFFSMCEIKNAAGGSKLHHHPEEGKTVTDYL